MLSARELEFFRENGFVGPFKLYEPHEAKALLRTIRIKNQDRTHTLFDNEVGYDRHFDISELSSHICHPGIINRLKNILDEDILCWRTEFFPKFPGSQGTEWHQVANYQYANGLPMLKPTLDKFPIDLTVWTTFTEATKQNGCMKFLPGSHKKKYYDESKPIERDMKDGSKPILSDTGFFGYNFSEFKIDPAWEPDEELAVAMEMQAGECVIFSATCVHASYPNTTERSTRFAISSRYVSTHVQVYPEQTHFYAHGALFDLTHYGCILVSGEDRYQHNKIREKNNLGEEFKFAFI